MRERVIFIVNPISGGRNKTHFSDLLNSTLDFSKYEARVVYTEYPGHATQLTEEALREGYKKVVAVGGDGTINEIAKVLMGKDAELGIIPYGSGNGLARHLGIPINPKKAIELLNVASTVTTDAGLVNGMPFFCTSGIGFDAHIGKVFSTLKGRGFLGYVKAVLKELISYKPEKYRVIINGIKKDLKAFLITFANASQYGNNAYIAPRANVQDGMLDVCILNPFPIFSVPELVARIFNKTVDRSQYVITIKGNYIKVVRNHSGPIHLDGEPFDTGRELNVQVVPSCLRVMTRNG